MRKIRWPEPKLFQGMWNKTPWFWETKWNRNTKCKNMLNSTRSIFKFKHKRVTETWVVSLEENVGNFPLFCCFLNLKEQTLPKFRPMVFSLWGPLLKSPRALEALQHNHGGTDWFGLEEKDHPAPILYREQGHLPQDQVFPSSQDLDTFRDIEPVPS